MKRLRRRRNERVGVERGSKRERERVCVCVCVRERRGKRDRGRESIIVCQSGHEKAARIYNRSRLILIDSD